MCACTEPNGTGIGAVCVERGVTKQSRKTILEPHSHPPTPAHTISTRHTLLSYDRAVKGDIFLEKQKDSRFALARLMTMISPHHWTTYVLASGLAVAFVIAALAVSAGPSPLVLLSVLVVGHFAG